MKKYYFIINVEDLIPKNVNYENTSFQSDEKYFLNMKSMLNKGNLFIYALTPINPLIHPANLSKLPFCCFIIKILFTSLGFGIINSSAKYSTHLSTVGTHIYPTL